MGWSGVMATSPSDSRCGGGSGWPGCRGGVLRAGCESAGFVGPNSTLLNVFGLLESHQPVNRKADSDCAEDAC